MSTSMKVHVFWYTGGEPDVQPGDSHDILTCCMQGIINHEGKIHKKIIF